MKKAIFSLVILVLMSGILSAQAVKPVFIVMTTTFRWPNGVESAKNEVEKVLKTNETSYSIWHPGGVEFLVPKSHAKIISSDEAADRLILQRQELYTELSSPDTVEDMQAKVNLLKSMQDLNRDQLEYLKQMQTLKQKRR